jgi:RNA polymerase sigma-70 factor (ECF subfamily)
VDAVYVSAHLSERADQLDESEVIDRALLDRAAFAPLYHRYARRVFQYLLARCDSPDDAADLVQLVFLRAMEALPRLRTRHRGSFAAWLFRIAHNTAADARRYSRPTVPWDHVPEMLLLYPGPSPEAAAVQRDDLNTLRMVIAELDEAKQELLALRFAGELSIAEIALTVGKSEAAVRKQLVRTVHNLQEQFHSYGL